MAHIVNEKIIDNDQESEYDEITLMKLSNYLTTVTPLSKALALFFLILFPIVGFLLGVEYKKSIPLLNVPKNKIPVVQNNTSVKDSRCDLNPDPGTCKAYFPSFYFDKNVGKCKQFVWGGCGETKPFTTLKDCQSVCQQIQWKTFTSNVIPLKLEAPSDWKLTESVLTETSHQKTVIISSSDFHYDGSQIAEGFSIQIGPISDKGTTYKSFEQFVQERNMDGKGEVVILNGKEWLKYPTQALSLYNNTPLTVSISYRPQEEETAKTLFTQILSTFGISENNSSVTIRGKVIENLEKNADNGTTRYLTIQTDNEKRYEVIYYDIAPYSACIAPDSDVAQNIVSGEKVEIYGDLWGPNTMGTCASNDYYIKVLTE